MSAAGLAAAPRRPAGEGGAEGGAVGSWGGRARQRRGLRLCLLGRHHGISFASKRWGGWGGRTDAQIPSPTPLWSWVTNHLRCINHLFLLVSRGKISLMFLRPPSPPSPTSKSILSLRVCLLIIIKIVSYTSASLVCILSCR